jgi:hypothetical protein
MKCTGRARACTAAGPHAPETLSTLAQCVEATATAVVAEKAAAVANAISFIDCSLDRIRAGATIWAREQFVGVARAREVQRRQTSRAFFVDARIVGAGERSNHQIQLLNAVSRNADR